MSKKQLALSTAALVGITLCLMGATYRNKRSASQPEAAVTASTSDVHGLVIGLQPTGFNPSRLNIPEGSYLFIVQNRSGIRDLTFRVSAQGGAVIHEVHDQRLQWKKIIQLPAGTYTISVIGHPDWESIITVSAS
jgi:hypothetical protein